MRICGRSPARFKTPPCHGGDRGFKSHRPRNMEPLERVAFGLRKNVKLNNFMI